MDKFIIGNAQYQVMISFKDIKNRHKYLVYSNLILFKITSLLQK